ncbi:MAG: Gfo/Idh/MocA family oxidoreductase [Lentisphaerae bacterium]|nr:Gfo/Idh/MocA family oxidoreductase [Lentisphaerota bacterium]
MKRIKVGIIGQGRSGRDIHRHLLECCAPLKERFDVVAVADPIAERRANTNEGANPECKHYADYKEMLQDKNIELIVNACRSHKHVDISIEAMEAGFNVLCEKPLAKCVADVDRLFEVQKKTGKFFAVFQQARFRPLFTKMCDIIKSGVLGEIAMVKVAYNGFGRRWDWQTIQGLNGGELLNTAPHPLDQMISLWDIFGESDPDEIFSKLAVINNLGDAEDFVKVVLKGEGHPIIDLEVTKECLFPGKMYQVFGANGSLVADGNTIEYKYYIPADAPEKQLSVAPLEGEGRLPLYCWEKLNFYSEKIELPEAVNSFDDWGTRYYTNIYNAITNGEPLVVKLSQVRRQIAIIEECHRQNPMKTFVEVPEGTL